MQNFRTFKGGKCNTKRISNVSANNQLKELIYVYVTCSTSGSRTFVLVFCFFVFLPPFWRLG